MAFTELFTTDALLVAGENEVSGWLDFQTLNIQTLLITRTATLGAYALEVDWSADGVAVDVVEVIPVANDTSVAKTIAARYGRVRVRNTDAETAFTAHHTVVTGRS